VPHGGKTFPAAVQRRGSQLILAPFVVDLLRREVHELLRFVFAAQPVPFADDRHQCVATIETDATPTTLGLYLRVPPGTVAATSAWQREVLAGLTVPTRWRDVSLDHVPVGVTELAAVVLYLDGLVSDPELRPVFERCRIRIGVDNVEAETAVNTWTARGAHVIPKWELLVVLADILGELGSSLRLYHVPTADNRSDEPTRSTRYMDVRLLPHVFRDVAAWALLHLNSGMDLTCDLMSSANCPQYLRSGLAALPYIGQLGDPEAGWHDLFAQPLGNWEGLFGYMNPPDIVAEHAVRYVLSCGCAAVLLLREYPEPAPAWLPYVRARSCGVLEVPAPHSELRVGNHLSGGFRISTRVEGRVAYLVLPASNE
jgi:hypothetical protein